MSRSLADAVKAAQQATNAAAAEQNARMRTVRAQLDEVERLARDVRQLSGTPVPAR
jgi:hypothetical protein